MTEIFSLIDWEEGQTAEQRKEIAMDILQQFGIPDSDLIATAYADLLK